MLSQAEEVDMSESKRCFGSARHTINTACCLVEIDHTIQAFEQAPVDRG